ncbi:MAG TPA: hypothetical protein VGN43_18965 [Steroidobacteraceae bacterium]|jgi:hypothetical protein|nr:hypothetical protein [Steroidobacteraceae bacterium]
MRRLHDLEARRRGLIARCEQQRLEIAYRLAELSPAAQLSQWTRRAPSSAATHPLKWLVSLATLLVMMRERRLVGWVGWVGKLSAGVALLSRATAVVRLLRQIRSLSGGVR